MAVFSDLTLSKRLEGAEGNACVGYAEARRRLFPDSRSEWMECAGAYAVFDGVGSPTTQSFGLGLFEELSTESLNRIEQFFFDRGASAEHEVSPFAGGGALKLLCERGYRPLEISSVLYRPIELSEAEAPSEIRVRAIGADDAALWSDVNARGWSHDHPEILAFVQESGAISTARKNAVCFLAEIGGEPAAAGGLCLHQGVALLAGAATIPEQRRRGLQAALLAARMRYAHEHGCDLLMMVTELGSGSQRNAERQGFRIAYSRIKWRLPRPE